MGNVLAASVPPPPSPPPPTSGLLPNLEKSDSTEILQSSSNFSDGLKNPGTIEDLHKKCKGICTSIRLSRTHVTFLTLSSFVIRFPQYDHSLSYFHIIVSEIIVLCI